MTWKVLPAVSSFHASAADWDRLNARLHGGHPLLDSRFVGALLTHFGSGDERLCLHDNGLSIDGALILKPAAWGQWASFLPVQAPLCPLLIGNARPLENLFFALPGYTWSIDLLAVDPDFGPDWSGFRSPRRTITHETRMSVAFPSGFDSYWQARPVQLLKDLARERTGADPGDPGLRLAMVTGAGSMASALARYAQLKPSAAKDADQTATGVDDDPEGFDGEIVRRFAITGQAQVAELYSDDTLAASQPMIRHERRWILLKTRYDESLSAAAPDAQLLFAVLRELASAQGAEVVEWCTNASRNQAEWATRQHPTAHQQIYRNDLFAGAHSLLARRPGIACVTRDPHPAPGCMIHSATVESSPQISQLAADAVELLQKANPTNAESSPEWFANLQATVFPLDTGVRYYVARFAGRAMAVLPVRHLRRGLVHSIDALGNFYTSLFGPALAPYAGPLNLGFLLARAQRERGEAHVMRFEPMDPESAGYADLLAALRSIDWIPFRFYCFGNWHLMVDRNWFEYRSQREGILRSTLKRKARRFAAQGGRLEIVTDFGAVEPAIRAYNEVYARSWKRPEPHPDFVPGLIRALAGAGKLRLGIAYLGELPIAAQIWIVGHGKASIFKLAYDEAHADSGSGTLLTAHLMQHVMDVDGVREVDYLIGDEAHKRNWMDHRRERWGIVAYNPRSFVGASLLAAEVVGRTLRKMTQTFARHDPDAPQTVSWQIEPIARFADLTADWDRLQAATTRVPFLESLFLRPLLDEFGTGCEVLAIARRQGCWCAAAILTRSRTGVWETFQPSQLPLGAWISALGSDEAAHYANLMRTLPGFSVGLNITQQDSLLKPRPEDTPAVRTLDYIQTAWVDLDRPFDTYWGERGKNLRTNTRKQRTKLAAEAVATHLECITDASRVAGAIEDYGALESAGWKGKDGTAVHPENPQGRFYRRMLENFCAAGRGRIYRYRFNDTPVAMDLCIESGDRLVILKTAYDESYKVVSPSTLMRQDEFRLLFADQKLKRIEFYGKVMEWHTRWTDQARALYHVTVYRWALLGRLHARRRYRQTAEAQPATVGTLASGSETA